MADYIERKALRNKLYDADAITLKGIKIFNKFPPAGVRPVVRGEWKKKRTPYDDNAFICTACLKQISVLGNPLAFCPNCGADMRGRGDTDG